MKKLGLVLIGVVAASVALSSLGDIVGLVVSLAIVYALAKAFFKSSSTVAKVVLAIIGFSILSGAAANIPAIFGLLAIYVMYEVVKRWKKQEDKPAMKQEKTDDPFANFEKQWAELNNK